MRVNTQLITAIMTLAIALCIGFVMQHRDDIGATAWFAPDAEDGDGSTVPGYETDITFVAAIARNRTPAPSSEIVEGMLVPNPPPLPELATRAVAAPERFAVLDAGFASPRVDLIQELGGFGLPCDVTFTAEPQIAAMVRLTLNAACKPYANVAIEHEGMRFVSLTSNIGQLVVDVPALRQDAEFHAIFSDGREVSARVDVPDFEMFTRAVLQWTGENGLSMHAFENGAEYLENGHIRQDNPSTASAAASGLGGFLVTLGDRDTLYPQLATVYSFPSALQPGAVVRMAIEAEITGQNCGQTVEAQTIQPTGSGGYEPVDVAVTLPTCGSVGDVLVLKNLVRDLKLAQN